MPTSTDQRVRALLLAGFTGPREPGQIDDECVDCGAPLDWEDDRARVTRQGHVVSVCYRNCEGPRG